MTNLTGKQRERYVQAMFTQIAPRYDLMNRLMTGGQDVRWRRAVIRRARLPKGGKLLDLGSGTGDLAREALRQVPGVQATAADFTLGMMRVGQRHSPGLPLDWCAADALRLPFPGECFDAVVSGFLLRNVTDVRQALQEQMRVLKPGGRLVALDTTPPPDTPWKPLIELHLHAVIPSLGRLLTGQAEAYTYLPESTEGFLQPEQLAARMIALGFEQVSFERYMFGTVAIHCGVKPA